MEGGGEGEGQRARGGTWAEWRRGGVAVGRGGGGGDEVDWLEEERNTGRREVQGKKIVRGPCENMWRVVLHLILKMERLFHVVASID